MKKYVLAAALTLVTSNLHATTYLCLHLDQGSVVVKPKLGLNQIGTLDGNKVFLQEENTGITQLKVNSSVGETTVLAHSGYLLFSQIINGKKLAIECMSKD